MIVRGYMPSFLNKKNTISLIKAEIFVKEKKQGKIIFKVNINLNKNKKDQCEHCVNLIRKFSLYILGLQQQSYIFKI